MIAIPNMEKPKKGEVIAFDGENAVYTDDDMNVHRYPLIEIDEDSDIGIAINYYLILKKAREIIKGERRE